MTDSPTSPTEAHIDALLGKHRRCFPAIAGRPNWCSGCDWTGDSHHTHLAAVLAEYVASEKAGALREAADAWEQEDTDVVGDWLRDRADSTEGMS